MAEIRCKYCKNSMTWAAQRVQFGRLIKNGYKMKFAKLFMPLCQKCNTIFIRKEKAMIKLFKNGDSMGILTDCKDERAFVGQFTALLAGLIEENRFEHDWSFQLDYWMPQFVDICCKYRGYKANVIQKTIIKAGDFAENDKDSVGVINDRDEVDLKKEIAEN